MSDETTSQRDTETSQRETRQTDTKPTDTQKPTDTRKPETDDNGEELSEEALRTREAAKYRSKTRELESQIADLNAKLEEVENAKLTDTEKLQKVSEKLQKQLAEAELKAQMAERKFYSSQSVQSHDMPPVLADVDVIQIQGRSQEEIEENAKMLASELEKFYRKKLAQVQPPNPEGGDKSGLTHAANGKPTAEIQQQNNREYAKAF